MSLLWALGKALQFLALVQLGYALLIGMNTNDPTRELTLLGAGILEFVAGLILLKLAGSKR
jgi:hypothetical protein